MTLIDILLLSIALGIDCFVVSFSQGLIFKTDRIKTALRLAFTMGLFQGFMPVIGYAGANSLYKTIVPYSNKIVFALFFILGIKFILEAFNTKEEKIECLDMKCLIGLGIATSIDALVSGATLKLTQTNLLLSAVLIGITSFLMSTAGYFCGHSIKQIPAKYLEIAGGIILILLAIKSLY